MRKIGKGRAPEVVNGPFRSVQRSGRCGVGELLDGSCDPAPGIGTVVITVSRELVDTRAALLERFVAVAPQHQSGGTPDIDLGYHAKKIAGLPSKKRLTPIIAWLAKLRAEGKSAAATASRVLILFGREPIAIWKIPQKGGGGVRLEIVGGSSNDMMAKVPGGITQAEGSFDSSPRRRPTTPRRRQAGAAWPSGPRLEVGQAPSATKGPRSTASSKRRHGKPPGSMDTLVAKQAQKRA